MLAELRQSGEAFHGVILTEGRAASGGRAEIFTPGSLVWPESGIAITSGHGGERLANAVPSRGAGGEIRIEARATEALRAAVGAGRKFMSIEFRSLSERTTKAGVREIFRAFVDVAALVASPEYDTTKAEVRDSGHKGAIWGCLAGC